MTPELDITVNGSPMRLPAGSSVADLLERLKVSTPRVAVERNREIVPKASYGETRLEAGDAFEVVELVGGGRAARGLLGRVRSAILRAPSGPLAQLVEQETLNL